jgi:hypothetical protein
MKKEKQDWEEVANELYELLKENPNPSKQEIINSLSE